MSYTDPNDPLRRNETDPLHRDTTHTTVVERTDSGSGSSWFIIGALVIAAGVLGYLYFGGNDSTVAENPSPAIEGEADTGRAATDMAPSGGMGATEAPAPAVPGGPADANPANIDSAPGANTPDSPQPTTPAPAQ